MLKIKDHFSLLITMPSTRSRGWCFTLNNYTVEEEFSVYAIECLYLIYGREVGDSDTPHLQGFIQFAQTESGKTLTAMKKLIPRAHFEPTKGSIDQNIAYCSKDGDFTEKGTKPMTQEKKGECGKRSLEERWALAKEGRFEELPPEQIKTYEYIYRKAQVLEDRTELTNIWVCGVSGCGKSRWVRDTYPEFYSKPMSKWWDGYMGEDVVVLDDFDPKHGEFLGYFLKIWADHYVFNAEVKGGMMKARPKVVIVTSQYSIDKCFERPEDVEAITRRFSVKTMGEPPVFPPFVPNFKPR